MGAIAMTILTDVGGRSAIFRHIMLSRIYIGENCLPVRFTVQDNPADDSYHGLALQS
jgi:hypothetical protein